MAGQWFSPGIWSIMHFICNWQWKSNMANTTGYRL